MDLEILAARLAEFDPSDDYHQGRELDAVGYYAAIDRAIRLIRGEIGDWKDQ